MDDLVEDSHIDLPEPHFLIFNFNFPLVGVSAGLRQECSELQQDMVVSLSHFPSARGSQGSFPAGILTSLGGKKLLLEWNKPCLSCSQGSKSEE